MKEMGKVAERWIGIIGVCAIAVFLFFGAVDPDCFEDDATPTRISTAGLFIAVGCGYLCRSVGWGKLILIAVLLLILSAILFPHLK